MVAEMRNNKLTINNLVGNIYRQNEKKLNLNRSNVKIEGEIDFSKFLNHSTTLK